MSFSLLPSTGGATAGGKRLNPFPANTKYCREERLWERAGDEAMAEAWSTPTHLGMFLGVFVEKGSSAVAI